MEEGRWLRCKMEDVRCKMEELRSKMEEGRSYLTTIRYIKRLRPSTSFSAG